MGVRHGTLKDDIDPAGKGRMLRPALFFEALQLLMCRHYYDVGDHRNALSEMWCGVLLSEINHGLVQEVEAKLSPEFRWV
jgi:hypothetical protein